jgi:S1-C subfamily serine protease
MFLGTHWRSCSLRRRRDEKVARRETSGYHRVHVRALKGRNKTSAASPAREILTNLFQTFHVWLLSDCRFAAQKEHFRYAHVLRTFKITSFILLAFATFNSIAFAQSPYLQTYGEMAAENSVDSVVTILLASDKQSHEVGSGLVVRSDGYILTAYHLIKDAREIQVRLRNGETYDEAEIISTDERRNVVILRITATNLSIIPNGTTEESQVGSRVFVVANPNGQAWIGKDGLLSAVQLADNIQGAGQGYRVLQFNTTIKENPTGGLLLDERGRTLGIVTNKNIAVPLTSILGFIRASSSNTPYPFPSSSTYTPASPSPMPVPIPQSSVIVPQRGVTPLSAKPPGAAVLKGASPLEVLKASKTIYVTSGTVFFKPEHLVNALGKKSEMNEWGLSFVDEYDLADLILEIDHVLFTYKFTFKLYSQRAGVTVASGSVIIWDGNLGADRMADRVIEKLSKVFAKDVKKETKPEKKE